VYSVILMNKIFNLMKADIQGYFKAFRSVAGHVQYFFFHTKNFV